MKLYGVMAQVGLVNLIFLKNMMLFSYIENLLKFLLLMLMKLEKKLKPRWRQKGASEYE